jgi:ATP-dependent Lon protease
MPEAEQILTLPLLPLKNSVLFPSVLMPLTVGRPLSMAAIEAVLAREDKELIVAAQRDASVDTPGPHDFFSIGTKAVIKRMARHPDGGVDLMVQGVERAVIIKIDQADAHLTARVRLAPVSEAARHYRAGASCH